MRLFQHLNTGNPDADIFAFNGGLFRPERIAGVTIPDAFLARALHHLARIKQGNKTVCVSYRYLETRHLGSIYEGLREQHLERRDTTVQLVSTAGERTNKRRSSGSYYTPDYIVEYIVQQTIDPMCKGKRADEIAKVVILDPSMGSGHFLVTALIRLAQHHAQAKKCATTPLPQRTPDETEQAFDERMNAYDATIAPDEEEVAESQRELVEHCIYGVDLNPLAVELAKLALWLSTLAHDRSLSFLDHHLRVGNSLVGARLDVLGHLAIQPSAATALPHQMGLFEQVFTRVQNQLLGYVQKIADLPDKTPEQIHAKEAAYAIFRNESAPFRMVANLWVSRHFGNAVNDDQYEQALTALDEYYAVSPNRTPWDALATEHWFVYAQALSATHHVFHWELEFPQVFLRETGGFDVVIGNPPYVRQEQLIAYKPFFARAYTHVYHGTADLYVYFLGQGLRVLRQMGRLSYISSNTWIRANYATSMRVFLRIHTTVEQLVDLGNNRIFADAPDVNPIILVIRKQKPPTDYMAQATVFTRGEGVKQFDQQVHAKLAPVSIHDQHDTGWQIGDDVGRKVFAKLMQGGTPLGELVQGRIYRDVLTGLNEAFIINQATRDRLVQENPNAEQIIKPMVRGEDIRPWYQESEGRYLVFARRGMNIDDYPSVKDYLATFREKLEPRPRNWSGGVWSGRKPGTYQWYEIQDPIGYYEAFTKPKIIWPDIAKYPRFSWDTEALYVGNTGYVAVTDHLWVLGFLASRCAWFLISSTAIALGERAGALRYRLIDQYMRPLPIPDAPAAERDAIGSLAMQISEAARTRYKLHQRTRHRIVSNLGTPSNTLNQKLTTWWNLDFSAFRAEVKKVFKRGIAMHDQDEWEEWLTERIQQHRQQTAQIVQWETDLNARVYALFDLSAAEIAIIEAQTKYVYGEV